MITQQESILSPELRWHRYAQPKESLPVWPVDGAFLVYSGIGIQAFIEVFGLSSAPSLFQYRVYFGPDGDPVAAGKRPAAVFLLPQGVFAIADARFFESLSSITPFSSRHTTSYPPRRLSLSITPGPSH